MIKYVAVVLPLFLCSCSDTPMTNEEVIKQVNLCSENGLDTSWQQAYSGLEPTGVKSVWCRPNESKKD